MSIPVLLMLIFLLSQASAQKLLLIRKTNEYKNYKYFENDLITLKLKSEKKRSTGFITDMADSSLILNGETLISFHDIEAVYRSRRLVRFAANGLKIFGITYFTLTGFNRALNKQYPVYDIGTLFISIGTTGGGYLLNFLLGSKKLNLERNWELSILDFSD